MSTNYAHDNIYCDDHRPTAYNKICSKILDNTIQRYKVVMTLIILSSIAGAANPIYIYFRDGILYTLAGVLIPFVEKGSSLETILNTIYQIVAAVFAILGLTCVQASISIMTDTIDVSTDLTILKMQTFSNRLKRGNLTERDIRNRLNTIFYQVKKIDKYIKKIINKLRSIFKINFFFIFSYVLSVLGMGYWYFFLSPIFLTYGIAFSIYAQLVVSFRFSFFFVFSSNNL